MKVYCLSLSLLIALVVKSAQGNEEEAKNMIKKIDEAEKVFCGKEVTDDQLAELQNKCKFEVKPEHDEAIKTCLKVTEVTMRQRMTAICKKEDKDCLTKGWTDSLSKAKSEEIAEHIKLFDKQMTCAKEVLKIQ